MTQTEHPSHQDPRAPASDAYDSRGSAALTLDDIEIQVVRDPLSEIEIIADPILSSARVSVVLPTLNQADNLPHVFERMPRDLFEVILVDGNSTDGTVDVAPTYGLAWWP